MLHFDVPDEKKIRVIIDTDAACEADDPFAIVHALLSPRLIVRGIAATHFHEAGSVQRSYDEILTILRAMKREVPVFMGEEGPLADDADPAQVSPAADFLIEEAMREDPHPLFVLCQGAITNVAAAMRKRPEIRERVTVVWIGTHGAGDIRAPFREFNAGNDVASANAVLKSGVKLWLVPSSVYTTITIGLAEIEERIAPCGEIGRHLFDNMVAYNNSPLAGWTQGESWSLGDSPAVAVTLNPGCGRFREAHAPMVEEDTSSRSDETMPMVRVYEQIDSRYVLGDFISKLRLAFPPEA
ncbi:MAG: nucleoside hydrolase [Lachnospiraceae bacterium]|nr:nucleoside hydrolase [Lachnospiraceae bacterium]